MNVQMSRQDMFKKIEDLKRELADGAWEYVNLRNAFVKNKELMDELVKERGGSLMMLAGPVAAPTSYKDTVIADILPVKIGAGSWNPIANGTHPIVTSDGRLSQSTSLSLSDDTTDRIWQKVNRMHQLPPLDGAKAGATVLLSHSGSPSLLPSQSLTPLDHHHHRQLYRL